MTLNEYSTQLQREKIEAAIWREEQYTKRPITPQRKQQIEQFYGVYNTDDEMYLYEIYEDTL